MTRPLPDPVELSDGVVALRRWADADVPALATIWQDPELQHRFGVAPPVDEAAAARLVRGHDDRWRAGLELALAVVADGVVVGGCELDHLDAPAPDLGYWLAPQARGHGYATRAAGLVVDWAAAELGVTTVRVEVEPDNAPSIAVAVRLGFTRLVGVETADGNRRLVVYERSLRP